MLDAGVDMVSVFLSNPFTAERDIADIGSLHPRPRLTRPAPAVQRTVMPAIDPSRTAVIAVHFQNDVVGAAGAFAAVLPRRGRTGRDDPDRPPRLLDAARAAGAKIVYTRVAWQPGLPRPRRQLPAAATSSLQQNCLVDGTARREIVDELTPQHGDSWSPTSGSADSTAASSTTCFAAPGSTPSCSPASPPTSPSRAPPVPRPTSATASSSSPTPARRPPTPPTPPRSSPSACSPRSPRTDDVLAALAPQPAALSS